MAVVGVDFELVGVMVCVEVVELLVMVLDEEEEDAVAVKALRMGTFPILLISLE